MVTEYLLEPAMTAYIYSVTYEKIYLRKLRNEWNNKKFNETLIYGSSITLLTNFFENPILSLFSIKVI